MNTEEFVKAFYDEKQGFLQKYLSNNPESEVGQLVKPLSLTNEQTEVMNEGKDIRV